MVKEILTAAGFVENKTFKETRFLQPPKKNTYAIYNRSVNRRGADNLNLLTDYSVSIELYEYAPDPSSEIAIEQQLDARNLFYQKSERYWIESEQLYQTVYDFDYTTKEATST
jgi:hypothetical protein